MTEDYSKLVLQLAADVTELVAAFDTAGADVGAAFNKMKDHANAATDAIAAEAVKAARAMSEGYKVSAEDTARVQAQQAQTQQRQAREYVTWWKEALAEKEAAGKAAAAEEVRRAQEVVEAQKKASAEASAEEEFNVRKLFPVLTQLRTLARVATGVFAIGIIVSEWDNLTTWIRNAADAMDGFDTAMKNVEKDAKKSSDDALTNVQHITEQQHRRMRPPQAQRRPGRQQARGAHWQGHHV